MGAGLFVAFHNIWFYTASTTQLEEMSTTGKISRKVFDTFTCLPFSMTSGPQSSIWYVDSANDCIARMTLSGEFYVVPTYSRKENPGFFTGIVVGQNRDLWFTATGTRGLGWIDPATI